MIKDYYKIIKVDKSSTDIEIKKSYRDLAIQLHPDKNKADHAHDDFVELNEAFQILSNETKRKKYDILYDHYINNPPDGLTNTAKEEFESIRNEARKESERISDSSFYYFMTEILIEMVGTALFSGLGNIIKGTGELICDTISSIDLDL